jgi:hypothetical protein
VINTGLYSLAGTLGTPEGVELPVGALIIRAGIDPAIGQPAFWYLYPEEAGRPHAWEKRILLVVATHTAVPDLATHRGMWWVAATVFHLFELPLDSDPSLLVNVFKKEAEDGKT